MLRWYLILSAIILIAVAATTAITRLRSRRGWKRTTGKIERWMERLDSDDTPSTYHFMEIGFWADDGTAHTFVSRIGHSSPLREIGAAIEIEYDPQNPSQAVENTFAAKWGFSLTFFLLGILCFCTGML